jgi:hypothetical protein
VAADGAHNGRTVGAGDRFGKNIGHFHPRRHRLGWLELSLQFVAGNIEKSVCYLIKNVKTPFRYLPFNFFGGFFNFANVFLRAIVL